jgi:DNA polymerase-4
VTVGIASNKSMARIAGKLAKPGGVCELWPGYERSLLACLPVEHLPGVGRSIGRELERFAIRTVGELALVSREVLFASFGAPGLVVHERARGIDDAPVLATFTWEPHASLETPGDVSATSANASAGRWIERPPRTIRRDSTFEPEEGRRAIVEAMLGYLVERAAHRLRLFHVGCRSLAVRVVFVDTRPKDEPASRSQASQSGGGRSAETRRPLPAPSDSTDELWQHARALFRALPRRRALVKRVGITLFNLAPLGGWQNQLFSDPGADRGHGRGHGRERDAAGPTGSRADRQRRLDHVLDELRRRHGFGRILRGTSYSLKEDFPLGEDGFQLRTPSLNQ